MKAVIFASVLLISSLQANLLFSDIVAGWDFQTLPGTVIVASPNTPKVFTSNFGLGTIYLDGTRGASDWVTTASGNEISGFAGTNVNAGPGFSTVTTSPSSLALLNQTANGKSATFAFSMAGFQNLVVSYATQRTATGFDAHVWEYSLDGTGFVALQSIAGNLPSAYATVTLNSTSVLDNSATAYLRLTLTGASSAAGNNRFDNIQFNASAVPEPSIAAIFGFLGAALAFRRTRSICLW